MKYRPDRYAALRGLLVGPRVEEEIDEEFEHHLAERTTANLRAGMSASAAREDALRRFGDRERFREQTRAIDESVLKEQKRMEIFDAVRREFRQAIRGLLRVPGFSLTAVATLALGIGAATAVYAMLDAVVLNPLPYAASDRLVKIDHAVPSQGKDVFWDVATASYFHYGERARSFDGYGAYWVLRDTNLRGRGDAFRGSSVQVTASLLPLLGAEPVLGRFFRPEEDVPNAPIVAVLSYELWQREYGGSRDVIGQTVEIEGSPTEIIGVAPRGFKLPDHAVDVWYPRRISLAMEHRNWHHLEMVARRRPGVSVEAAQAELMALVRELPERFPSVYTESKSGTFGTERGFHPRVRDLRESVIGNLSRVLWIVLGSVSLVLVVACVNVANLFLVRSETRRNEAAVRAALGAERAHLLVQAMTESLIVTLGAALLGLWLASVGLQLLLAVAPQSLPRISEVRIGWNAAVFALVLGVAAGIVFASFALFRRMGDYAPLRESGRGLTTTRSQLRVRSSLVVAQIALALVLLAAGGLMLRSYYRLSHVASGIDTENVLTLDVAVPFVRYDSYEKAAGFWRELTRQLAAVPGVRQVGAASQLPFSSTYMGCATLWADPIPASGGTAGCVASMTLIPGYLETLGVPVRGRYPTWNDVDVGSGAIVITKSLADRLWPGQDAMGKGIRGNGPGDVYFRVVGVAADFRMEGFQKPPTQLVFFPPVPIKDTYLWGASTALNVVLKTTTDDPEQIGNAVRRAIGSLDPSAATGDVRTMKSIVGESMVTTSFTMVLLGVAGFMAVLLSVVGLYGVVSYVVTRRRGEIGIRMALGAPAADVSSMIVMQSVRLAAIGVGAGLFGAFFTTQMLRSLLFEVEPTDAITLTATSFFLLATSAVASFLPARRAARVSPVEALKAD